MFSYFPRLPPTTLGITAFYPLFSLLPFTHAFSPLVPTTSHLKFVILRFFAVLDLPSCDSWTGDCRWSFGIPESQQGTLPQSERLQWRRQSHRRNVTIWDFVEVIWPIFFATKTRQDQSFFNFNFLIYNLNCEKLSRQSGDWIRSFSRQGWNVSRIGDHIGRNFEPCGIQKLKCAKITNALPYGDLTANLCFSFSAWQYTGQRCYTRTPETLWRRWQWRNHQSIWYTAAISKQTLNCVPS